MDDDDEDVLSHLDPCVSHDAVHLVSGTRVLLASRATRKFLSLSSAPVFGFFSLQLHLSFVALASRNAVDRRKAVASDPCFGTRYSSCFLETAAQPTRAPKSNA